MLEYPSVTAFTGSGGGASRLQQPHILGHLEGLVKPIVLLAWIEQGPRGGNVSRENFNDFNNLDCLSVENTKCGVSLPVHVNI